MQFGLLVTEVLGFRACWQESPWSFRAGGQSVVGIASFLALPVRKFVRKGGCWEWKVVYLGQTELCACFPTMKHKSFTAQGPRSLQAAVWPL